MTTKTIQLTASDGHRLTAFVAEPKAKPIGALILVQEIFGVTRHMQSLAIRYAGYGFKTIVPALFDRVQADAVISYSDPERGRAIAQRCDTLLALKDLNAACQAINTSNSVGVVGYCWGGTFAYLAACNLNIKAAVSYYGTRIVDNLQDSLTAPIQFHFGLDDQLVSAVDVAKIQQAHPQQKVWVYEHAGHAFACEDRPSYNSESSQLAEQRTLKFLLKTLC